MADLPPDVALVLAHLQERVAGVERLFAPLLALAPAELATRLSAYERTKLRLLLAYALNALFYGMCACVWAALTR